MTRKKTGRRLAPTGQTALATRNVPSWGAGGLTISRTIRFSKSDGMNLTAKIGGR